MSRKTLLAWPVVCALAVASCSGSPETMLSPSSVVPEATFVNPDGSTIKVGAPDNLQPAAGAVIDSQRPTLQFANPRGLYASVGWAYAIEVQDGGGRVLYARTIGEGANVTSHVLDIDLEYSTTYWWRARVHLGDQFGPWSGFAEFRTPAPPRPPAPSAAELGFVIPGECGPFGPGDRFGCVLAMTAVSPWWAGCRAGSGRDCHRFTRTVAAALAASDPGWGLLSKNPGEQQCSWHGCGPGDGSGYGEDVVVHLEGGTLRGWDIVVGAGAPGASPNWARLEGFRAGNFWVPVPMPLGTR